MSSEHKSWSKNTCVASSETSSQKPNKDFFSFLFLHFLSHLINSLLAIYKVDDIAGRADIKVARETASEVKKAILCNTISQAVVADHLGTFARHPLHLMAFVTSNFSHALP